MLRKILFTILLIISFLWNNYLYSQLPVDSETKLVTYSEVVKANGTKDQLYDRAVAWFNSFYKKNIIDICQVLDKNNGNIAGTWKFKLYETDNNGQKKEVGIVNYNISIGIKDGKYKYTLTKFVWKKPPFVPIEKWLDKKDANYEARFEDFIKQTTVYVNDLVSSLKKGMEKQEKKAEDW
jgi:hypothetical protein